MGSISNGERSNLRLASADDTYDLICVGFGPASLSVAVALHDALEAGTVSPAPSVLFLEKQRQFSWHAGMLLPGSRMQISFIKDLATLRDPRSQFTFLNYLHHKDRLIHFTNLDTFQPERVEYEDYMRWVAGHFGDVVRYHTEVVDISPAQRSKNTPVGDFSVLCNDLESGATVTYKAKNLLLAIGGQPAMPGALSRKHPRLIHSSQYATSVARILTDHAAPYRVMVVGGGQSAAEIFASIQTLYPNSHSRLVMRSEFLKPADDSPFVNGIFNPAYVDHVYSRSPAYRSNLIQSVRNTNYGVVDLELVEQLYASAYDQRRRFGGDETKWRHRIIGGHCIVGVEEGVDLLRVRIRESLPGDEQQQRTNSSGDDAEASDRDEVLCADLVIAATGYERRAHVEILRGVWDLLPSEEETCDGAASQSATDRLVVRAEGGGGTEKPQPKVLSVDRDYRVRFAPGQVKQGSGIWLQGCCESTHGLSDTLLSILSTRSGEIVQSIFGVSEK